MGGPAPVFRTYFHYLVRTIRFHQSFSRDRSAQVHLLTGKNSLILSREHVVGEYQKNVQLFRIENDRNPLTATRVCRRLLGSMGLLLRAAPTGLQAYFAANPGLRSLARTCPGLISHGPYGALEFLHFPDPIYGKCLIV